MDQKCQKLSQNDVPAWAITWSLQKQLTGFWIPIFRSKFQSSQPCLYPDRAIKILQISKKIASIEISYAKSEASDALRNFWHNKRYDK